MMGIRLNEKDLSILLDTARFRSLSLETIRHVHFDGSTYAWTRLNALYENGYMDRKYYYEIKKTVSGMNHAQRIAVFYFPTPKGLKTIDYCIDPRFVVPDDKKLDVNYMVSQLYRNIPDLLPKREAQEKYPIKNFMPVTCMVPQERPVFISILGKNKGYKEESKLIKFVEAKIFSGTYVIISNRFPGEKLLFTDDSYYIHNNLAPEVIPNMLSGWNYLEEFIIKKIKPTSVVGYKEPFTQINIPGHGVCNVAELLTGSTRLMLFLRNPPEKTYVYVDSIKQMHGVKLESGSFHVFSREKQKFYRVYIDEHGKMKNRLID